VTVARFGWPAIRLVAILCLLKKLLLLFEKSFIYFPTRAYDATPSGLGLPHEDVWLVAENKIRIHGEYLPITQTQ
jgi:hypothetical protein